MKAPEFTIQDFQGKLNADGDATMARLIKGASWKKQRIIMLIPAGPSIPSKVYLSHVNMIFPPNQGVVRILAQGMEVGKAYSAGIDNILSHPDLKDWEYVLTLEHDNCPPSDGVLQLLEAMEAHPEYDCIGGLYYTKGEGGVPQVWGDRKDPVMNFRPQLPDPRGGLVECWGTGMGFNLWRLSMFKDTRIPKPWFETKAGPGGVGTQDLAFWGAAQAYGHRCAIHCGVKVGHYDAASDIMW